MCTAINYKNGFCGRNLDLEFPINFASVAIAPRNHPFKKFTSSSMLSSRKAMIGMAMAQGQYPLYFEAMNEAGLFAAGLDFRGYAHYWDEELPGRINLASFELIPYLLGQFSTVEEVRKVAERIAIVNVGFDRDLPPSPLHWFVSDRSRAIVVEQTKGGLRVYDDPFGVLTNCPDFPYHLENMRNHVRLDPRCAQSEWADMLGLKPISNGGGTEGLPGGLGSVPRFVRAAYARLTSVSSPDDEIGNVTQFFHILDSVKQIRGQVVGLNGQHEITVYSCCASANTLTYYYKTYENSQIGAISLKDVDLDRKGLSVFSLDKAQSVRFAG